MHHLFSRLAALLHLRDVGTHRGLQFFLGVDAGGEHRGERLRQIDVRLADRVSRGRLLAPLGHGSARTTPQAMRAPLLPAGFVI